MAWRVPRSAALEHGLLPRAGPAGGAGRQLEERDGTGARARVIQHTGPVEAEGGWWSYSNTVIQQYSNQDLWGPKVGDGHTARRTCGVPKVGDHVAGRHAHYTSRTARPLSTRVVGACSVDSLPRLFNPALLKTSCLPLNAAAVHRSGHVLRRGQAVGVLRVALEAGRRAFRLQAGEYVASLLDRKDSFITTD